MELDHPYFPIQRSTRGIYQDWEGFDTAWFLVLGFAAVLLYTLGLNQPLEFSPLRLTHYMGAVVAAGVVPLLYCLGRELFLQRPAALVAASLYLTHWAVLPLGQRFTATGLPQGLALCVSLVVVYCVLRSRRDLRWTLGIGIGLGTEVLLDPIGAAALVAIATSFILWDTPRILTAKHFWWGTGLGLLAIALGVAMRQELQGIPFWVIRPGIFPRIQLGEGLLAPLLDGLKSGQGWRDFVCLPWMQALPWICFWPMGLAFLTQHYNLSWGRFCLIWGSASLALVILGYGSSNSVYIALSLICGAYLARFWQIEAFWGLPHAVPQPLPLSLRWSMAFFTGYAWWQVAYGVHQKTEFSKPLQGLLIVVAIAISATTILAWRNHPLWLPTLIWGTYCLLLCLRS